MDAAGTALIAGAAFGAGVGLTCLLQTSPSPEPPPRRLRTKIPPLGPFQEAVPHSPPEPPSPSGLPSPPPPQTQVADSSATRTTADFHDSVSSADSLSPRSPPAAQLAPLEGVFGVDIGGTLAKLVFLEKLSPDGSKGDGGGGGGNGISLEERLAAAALKKKKRRSNFITARERFGSTGQRYTELEFPCAQLGGVLHFIKFETRRLDSALRIVKDAGLLKGMARVYMGGGGAFKYQRKIEAELGVVCVPVDEFEALVWGIDYVLQHGPQDEVSRASHVASQQRKQQQRPRY